MSVWIFILLCAPRNVKNFVKFLTCDPDTYRKVIHVKYIACVYCTISYDNFIRNKIQTTQFSCNTSFDLDRVYNIFWGYNHQFKLLTEFVFWHGVRSTTYVQHPFFEPKRLSCKGYDKVYNISRGYNHRALIL